MGYLISSPHRSLTNDVVGNRSIRDIYITSLEAEDGSPGLMNSLCSMEYNMYVV